MKVSIAARVKRLYGERQCPAIAPRVGGSQCLHAVVEGDERYCVIRAQHVNNMRGAALGLFERLAGHRARTVDDEPDPVGRALADGAFRRLRCLDADENVDLVVEARDEGRTAGGKGKADFLKFVLHAGSVQ